MKGDLPGALNAAIRAVKEKLHAEPKEIATRTACEFALESIIPAVPEMIGGSADLTGSNNTRTKSMKAMTPTDFSGALHPLRHPRARHGRGDERHGAAPAASSPTAAPSWCSPTIAGRRSGSPP